MISIFFAVWTLFSTPTDRMICSMWLSKPPTAENMITAGCNWSPEITTDLVWRGVNWRTGQIACERPASELPNLSCNLFPLDGYLIQVHDPHYQEQLCQLQIDHPGQPTGQEILSRCPSSISSRAYELRQVSSGYYTPSAPAMPPCQMPDLDRSTLPLSPDQLATFENYQLLSYHLRWWYGTDGGMMDWQNQFDKQIYTIGISLHVPPKTIKRLFALESQFWPLWDNVSDPDQDEVGIGQLTDSGADLVLRYSNDLYTLNCPAAAPSLDCANGYDLLSPSQRSMLRTVLRRSLIDIGTPTEAAAQAKGQILAWGNILKAYYCAAGETVNGWGDRPASRRWDMTLAAYHAGLECIRDGEICLAGRDYLEGK
jgi:hypothetical protein